MNPSVMSKYYFLSFHSILVYIIIKEVYHNLLEHLRGNFIMEHIKVRKLLINYKTLEAFKRFKAYGNQELSMLEDLESNMVEDDSKSPFYGVYYGDNLVARMSLYQIKKKYDFYFEPPQDYLALWKLEVLPDYRGKGYGKALVDYAKSYQLPIKTNPLINSHGFRSEERRVGKEAR